MIEWLEVDTLAFRKRQLKELTNQMLSKAETLSMMLTGVNKVPTLPDAVVSETTPEIYS